MATLWISEYARPAPFGGDAPACQEPAEMDQVVTFAASTASAAFGPNTHIVRLIADADCHLSFGSNPAATAENKLMKEGVAEFFGVAPGMKVAAYDGSS